MDNNGRPNHIEDALIMIHSGQWFGWSDSKNKINSNLILHPKCFVDKVYKDNPYSKPTEKEVNDKLKELQDTWDSANG